MNSDLNYAFPVTPVFTKEEMQQHFWKCLYTSAPQKMLHYWVALPKNLKPAEINSIAWPEVGSVNIGRYITSKKIKDVLRSFFPPCNF